MAKSSLKAPAKGSSAHLTPVRAPQTITLSITITKTQFKKLGLIKERHGQLSEQDVIRLFIANGTKDIQL